MNEPPRERGAGREAPAARGDDPQDRAGRRSGSLRRASPGWTTTCAWFRTLPADQRSWVTLVAQAGIASFVEWLRSPDDVLRLTGEVFGTAPRAMARTVTFQQTVEMVRKTIGVAEEQMPMLAAPVTKTRCARNCCASAGRSPLRPPACTPARPKPAARGTPDSKHCVIDGLVRGGGIGGEPESQLRRARLAYDRSGDDGRRVSRPTRSTPRTSWPRCIGSPTARTTTRSPACTAAGSSWCSAE